MLKKKIPVLLCFLAGLLPIISFFFTSPGDGLREANDTLEQWLVVVSGFALLLGVISVFQVNLRKISNRSKGWVNAIYLLASLVIMGAFGLMDAFSEMPGWGWVGTSGNTGFNWIFDAIFQPLQSTMFSLLAFYVASAAFRAFRARNLEAGLLLAAAMVVMLGINPYVVKVLPFLPEWTRWIMNGPNAAAQRGIIIGAALGAASMTLRILLGIERSWLGLQEGE
ncbi:MAG: hypothetical protein GY835_26135 [bacterium]|nr:hypothetical protein [bacterium]